MPSKKLKNNVEVGTPCIKAKLVPLNSILLMSHPPTPKISRPSYGPGQSKCKKKVLGAATHGGLTYFNLQVVYLFADLTLTI
jgi:hypothetical protein